MNCRQAGALNLDLMIDFLSRTSYLPSEILWGHRFEPLITFRKELSQYAIDYTLFHHTYEYDTPVCSAKELDELKTYEDEMKRQGR